MTCMAASSELVLIAVRQHREEARTLDAGRQLALEERACAGQARRRDLAVLADEIAQGVDVLVVDFLDAGHREAAEALAAEQQGLGVAFRLAVLREPAFTTWRGHGVPLSKIVADRSGGAFSAPGSVELGDVEDDAAAVALRTQEAGEAVAAAELALRQSRRDLPQGPRLDLDRDLARLAFHGDLRFVPQAQVKGRDAGWGVSQRAAFHQLCLKNQTVQGRL